MPYLVKNKGNKSQIEDKMFQFEKKILLRFLERFLLIMEKKLILIRY